MLNETRRVPSSGSGQVGAGAFETDHVMTRLGGRVGEQDAEFAGGEICDSPDFVDRFEARAAGDNDFHGV